ncbi:hypothetical protein REPUB_Repub08aG0046500 [Reevesia pubescens]
MYNSLIYPAIDAPDGFLFEWWSVFWDIFISRTNDKHSEAAAAYIKAQQIKAKEQHQLQMQQLQLMRQAHLQRRDPNHPSICYITASVSIFYQKGVQQRDFFSIPYHWLVSNAVTNADTHMHRRKHKSTQTEYHLVALLAITVGPGDNAQEILEESMVPLSQTFKSVSESFKIASSAWLSSLLFGGMIQRKQKKQCK